jgi:succinylglutamate desuccinylase
MLKLNIINGLPDGLLELSSSREIQQIFTQPTLMNLRGKQTNPLFISVLLHANEDTGFLAVQQLLRKYQDKELPRSLSIFFGNIEASKEGLRRLPGQPDYNRVWPGTDHPECEETRLMQEVVDEVVKQKPFASIDVHNNTGKNPHYGCINSLEDDYLHLAALFSHIIVFFETPKGVQSMAMAKHCPAVTLECGQPHLPHGTEHATDFLETVMHLENFNTTHVNRNDIDVFQTVARVTVPKSCTFSFTEASADIFFDSKLDRLNFSELTEETVFGQIQNADKACLEVWDDHEQSVSNTYFINKNNKLVLSKPVMPAMLTLDEDIIRQDCLCYLMKRLELT